MDTSKHSLFAPSGFQRNIDCPASFKEQILHAQPAEGESNIYAFEGTLAHNFAADLLRFRLHKNKQGKLLDIDEIVKYTNEYCDYVEDLADEDKFILIEQSVNLDHILPKYEDTEQRGTADAIIHTAKNNHMHVVDLKYGKGKVEVADNPQLILYALGAMKLISDRYGKKTDIVTIHIYQPRINHIVDHSYTRYEMDKLAHDYFKYAIRCLHEEPNYNKNYKNCNYCAARGKCKAWIEDAISGL